MADLEMPQRQTFPAIRGEASDENGLLPLADADSLTVWIEPEGGGELFELPATVIDPPEEFTQDGVTYQANFEAPIGASGVTDAVADDLRGKLEVVWDSLATPPLVQFVPKTGFMTFEVTVNVAAAP